MVSGASSSLYRAPKPFKPKIVHRVLPVPTVKLPGDDMARIRRERIEREHQLKKREPANVKGPVAVTVKPLVKACLPLTNAESPFLSTKVRAKERQQVESTSNTNIFDQEERDKLTRQQAIRVADAQLAAK